MQALPLRHLLRYYYFSSETCVVDKHGQSTKYTRRELKPATFCQFKTLCLIRSGSCDQSLEVKEFVGHFMSLNICK